VYIDLIFKKTKQSEDTARECSQAVHVSKIYK
jgi:hypothetical protein